ncbi:long-chain-fatty-acid--CoA ligase [Desulfohalovibrio reitneri]|uniref:long-chain-fatty-acid--CoA ligase n=1 Tax=Desulfohalovibrio reitneri TaxID=1307759 RepID=UPI0004A778B8|nr:long-chain fatty acid--CoA ligase [Desulfohalovibrio reitneri]
MIEDRPWYTHLDPEVPPRLDYENIPLFEHLDRAAAEHPDKTAISFKTASVSYRDLHRLAEEVAAGLRADGCQAGDRVVIMLPNLPQAIIAYWGVLKAGCVCVMANPLYMEHELTHLFHDSGARRLITLDMLWEKIALLLDRLELERAYVTRVSDALPGISSWVARYRLWRAGKRPRLGYDHVLRPWKTLFGHGRHSQANILPHSDPALLQYTGGTTGKAKGCELTHANLGANLTQIRAILHAARGGAEVFLGVLPYFHVYGLTVCLTFPTSIAATMVPFPRFDPGEVLATIDKVKPTVFPGAPSVYQALMRQKEFAETDFKALRYCVSGSAPMPREHMRRFKEATGAEILEGYGLTEASPVTHLNPLNGMRKPGTIGIPLPDTDSRVVDMDAGGPDPLPPGKDGELIIKGPQVMKGYWNRPDETATALRNGWLYTGDIARMDEDGYFTIVDRKKDLIISGGFNIYPREIDEVLHGHPKIKEAVVIGIPHKLRGETIKAFVVPLEGEELHRQEVVHYCREKLASYKVPRQVEIRDELPKNLVGKVLRRALRDEELAKRKG